MKNTDIKILLEKYFEGETSLQEEKVLRHYFLYEDIADELADDKALFLAFQQESRLILENVDDEFIFTEKPSNIISLNRNTAWAVAASVLFLVGSWFMYNKQNTEVEIPNQHDLLVAQKYLKKSFQAFDRAYNHSSELIKKTEILQKQSKEALKVGTIYQENTKEILNVKYINQSFEKLRIVSKLKKSRIKLMM